MNKLAAGILVCILALAGYAGIASKQPVKVVELVTPSDPNPEVVTVVDTSRIEALEAENAELREEPTAIKSAPAPVIPQITPVQPARGIVCFGGSFAPVAASGPVYRYERRGVFGQRWVKVRVK